MVFVVASEFENGERVHGACLVGTGREAGGGGVAWNAGV
jgi:hypothetical protein